MKKELIFVMKYLLSLVLYCAAMPAYAGTLENVLPLSEDNQAREGLPLSDQSGEFNLRNLGANLNNSSEDKHNIQKIYNALPNLSVVHVPKDSRWDGTILSPDPNKHINWLFDGTYSGEYSHPPGDGDATISFKNGLQVSRMDTNTNNFITSPSIFFYWNDDSKYCGAYCYNWQQYSAATFSAISGPTSSGNTSPVSISLRSYGQGPSSSYDVGLPVSVWKYGQNSVWGLNVVTNDLSGKSPNAFASWNEFDMWTNGLDIKSWDKRFGAPQAGHRSVFYISGSHYDASSWHANYDMSAVSRGKGGVTSPSLINVQAADHNNYIWYPAESGKTGSSHPVFPVPTRINATIRNGIMSVSRVLNGDIKTNDYITGANPVDPVRVTGQIRGANGKEGVYTVDSKNAHTDTDEALYSTPEVVDGSVKWQFGEETNSSISSVMWITGNNNQDGYDTVVGIDKGIYINNAIIDSTLSKMPSKSAVVRMAPGQVIDFSGNGTRDGANKHTFDYENGALHYKVNGVSVISIRDDGSLQSELPSRLPLMTRAQIRAYPSPKKGMEIYDIDDNVPVVYTSKGWKLVALSDMPE